MYTNNILTKGKHVKIYFQANLKYNFLNLAILAAKLQVSIRLTERYNGESSA